MEPRALPPNLKKLREKFKLKEKCSRGKLDVVNSEYHFCETLQLPVANVLENTILAQRCRDAPPPLLFTTRI